MCIYMDVSNAFNALYHRVLFDKLSYYGIEGSAQKRLSNYLSSCTMYVVSDNAKSSVRNLILGVPQGSMIEICSLIRHIL